MRLQGEGHGSLQRVLAIQPTCPSGDLAHFALVTVLTNQAPGRAANSCARQEFEAGLGVVPEAKVPDDPVRMGEPLGEVAAG